MCRRNYQIICPETEGTIFVFCQEKITHRLDRDCVYKSVYYYNLIGLTTAVLLFDNKNLI